VATPRLLLIGKRLTFEDDGRVKRGRFIFPALGTTNEKLNQPDKGSILKSALPS
jgi:hypothetical protein